MVGLVDQRPFTEAALQNEEHAKLFFARTIAGFGLHVFIDGRFHSKARFIDVFVAIEPQGTGNQILSGLKRGSVMGVLGHIIFESMHKICMLKHFARQAHLGG